MPEACRAQDPHSAGGPRLQRDGGGRECPAAPMHTSQPAGGGGAGGRCGRPAVGWHSTCHTQPRAAWTVGPCWQRRQCLGCCPTPGPQKKALGNKQHLTGKIKGLRESNRGLGFSHLAGLSLLPTSPPTCSPAWRLCPPHQPSEVTGQASYLHGVLVPEPSPTGQSHGPSPGPSPGTGRLDRQ